MLAALISAASISMPGDPNWGPSEGWRGRTQVIKALRQIPTVIGSSAYDRMNACRFHIQWSVSWVEPVAIDDAPQFHLHRGDSTIQVIFNRPAADRDLARDNLARWFIRSGKLVADTGWASEIQNGAYPINRDGLSRC